MRWRLVAEAETVARSDYLGLCTTNAVERHETEYKADEWQNGGPFRQYGLNVGFQYQQKNEIDDVVTCQYEHVDDESALLQGIVLECGDKQYEQATEA